MKVRVLLGLAAAAVVSGVVVAAAASLGGITSDDLGADSSVVASCDTDGVSTSYTVVYDATDGRYEVTDVVVSGIAVACTGDTLDLTLTDVGHVSIGNGSLTIAGTSETVDVTPDPDAEAVVGVHIVIT